MSKKLTSAEIRQLFLEYFEKAGHTIVPSASLVPQDDPTLLFTNAGMNQFKDVFLSTGSRPYTRATDTQKCMRVAGKHNDLDDVGRDGTHHTFFEMLGNWSFGDYYKQEAIGWAWDLLTRVYGLSEQRLWATVFKDDRGTLGRDDEAARFWRTETEIDPEHILDFGRRDNFWEMGETGPCGPCSEIHYDQGPQACDKQDEPEHRCQVNGDCARFLELWNLVFIQYNNHGAGELEPLPAQHVDTGMGFERLVALLQNVNSNYRTDLFWPLIERTQELAGQSDAEREAQITAYRVIADHIRACTFLTGDGVLPANDGRGYVLRMVLRRAVRFGRELGFKEPFMAQLAGLVIELMGSQYPELPQRADFIQATILGEEERFLRTLDQGLAQLDEIIAALKAAGRTEIPGSEAFFLHDTLGLPPEVTEDIAAEHDLTVDKAGYHAAREEQRARARVAGEFQQTADEHAKLYPQLAESLSETVTHLPYGELEISAQVVGILGQENILEEAPSGSEVELVLNQTNFYAESGGQVSDTGRILGADWEFQVEELHEPIEGLLVHLGHVVHGTPHRGDQVQAVVDQARRQDIMRNHTATHLLHNALRTVLGTHVAQAGSLVEAGKLRFDYNHNQPLTAEQRTELEKLVNQAIRANFSVTTQQEDYRKALEAGVIALFGEKYGAEVRVVSVGEHEAPLSQELCGGTHVQRTGDIGIFLITTESGVGAGIRRIEAVTGRGALQVIQELRQQQEQAAALLGSPTAELVKRVERLQAELKETEREIDRLQLKLARDNFQALLNETVKVNGIPLLAAEVEAPDMDTLREMADWFRAKSGESVIVLGAIIDDKPRLIAATTQGMIKRGVHAGKLIGKIARLVGGGGGGRPDMAQAGGRDADKLAEALAQVPQLLAEIIG